MKNQLTLCLLLLITVSILSAQAPIKLTPIEAKEVSGSSDFCFNRGYDIESKNLYEIRYSYDGKKTMLEYRKINGADIVVTNIDEALGIKSIDPHFYATSVFLDDKFIVVVKNYTTKKMVEYELITASFSYDGDLLNKDSQPGQKEFASPGNDYSHIETDSLVFSQGDSSKFMYYSAAMDFDADKSKFRGFIFETKTLKNTDKFDYAYSLVPKENAISKVSFPVLTSNGEVVFCLSVIRIIKNMKDNGFNHFLVVNYDPKTGVAKDYEIKAGKYVTDFGATLSKDNKTLELVGFAASVDDKGDIKLSHIAYVDYNIAAKKVSEVSYASYTDTQVPKEVSAEKYKFGEYVIVHSVDETAGGGYVITAQTKTHHFSLGLENRDILVVKIDNKMQLEKAFNIPYHRPLRGESQGESGTIFIPVQGYVTSNDFDCVLNNSKTKLYITLSAESKKALKDKDEPLERLVYYGIALNLVVITIDLKDYTVKMEVVDGGNKKTQWLYYMQFYKPVNETARIMLLTHSLDPYFLDLDLTR